MREFMQASRQESNLKREQARKAMEKENIHLQNKIDDFTRGVREQEISMKNKSSLLGNILKEQILLRQQSKRQV